jgi:hypothetical protein
MRYHRTAAESRETGSMMTTSANLTQRSNLGETSKKPNSPLAYSVRYRIGNFTTLNRAVGRWLASRSRQRYRPPGTGDTIGTVP